MSDGTPPDLSARVRAVIRDEPALLARLLSGSFMHALGHAAVAASAGACARALAGGAAPAAGVQDARWWGVLRVSDARTIAFVGLVAVVVKVLASILAAQSEVAIAKEVGDRLRADLLAGWLRHHRLRSAGHLDQGGVPPHQADEADETSRAHPATAAATATLHVVDVEQGVTRGLIGRARAVVELVPLVVLLFALNAQLALAAAVCAAPFVLASGRARRHLRGEIARGHEELDALATAADEAVRHADLWTVFGAERRVQASVARLGKALRARASRVAVLAAATSGANEVLAALALVLTAVAAKAGWLGLSDGALLPFMVAFFLAYKPLRALSEARLADARAESMLAKMAPMLDHGHAEDAPSLEPRTWGKGSLEVRGLVVRGAGEPVSFDVRPGELVVLTGPTGAGKTTLLRALLGLERASAGTIEYAGESLGEASAGPSARPFSFVPQDAPIVADTLAENVALGGEEGARELLALLGAEPLSHALGDARLGPGGRALSGGERQLVCMARAFASRAPIVVLDEPTSGLDATAERAVLAYLAREKARRPILMVSHKPAPIAAADRVVHMA